VVICSEQPRLVGAVEQSTRVVPAARGPRVLHFASVQGDAAFADASEAKNVETPVQRQQQLTKAASIHVCQCRPHRLSIKGNAPCAVAKGAVSWRRVDSAKVWMAGDASGGLFGRLLGAGFKGQIQRPDSKASANKSKATWSCDVVTKTRRTHHTNVVARKTGSQIGVWRRMMTTT